MRMTGDRPRFADLHACLLGCAATFDIVAPGAGRHDVALGVSATLTDGHHMFLLELVPPSAVGAAVIEVLEGLLPLCLCEVAQQGLHLLLVQPSLGAHACLGAVPDNAIFVGMLTPPAPGIR